MNLYREVVHFLTKNVALGHSMDNLMQKCHSQCILWLNLLFILGVVLKNAMSRMLHCRSEELSLLLYLACAAFSLWNLRRARVERSAVSLLCCLHLHVFFMSDTLNMNLAGSLSTVVLPFAGVVISSSMKIQLANILTCLLQNVIRVWKTTSIFQVSLVEDQAKEIHNYCVHSFLALINCSIVCIILNNVLLNLFEILRSNNVKTENITKELVQAIEAKNRFLPSFSHEVRNSLNAINASIDYLLSVITDNSQLEVLKNARLGAKLILNFINNLLDASKLERNEFELRAQKSSASDIIKQVLAINQESIKNNGLQVRAFIDRKMPSSLQLDSSRVIQIIMNLLSNSMKYTDKGGKILIYMAWCQDRNKDELLSPIEESMVVLGKPANLDIVQPSTSTTSNAQPQDINRPSSREEYKYSESEICNSGLVHARPLNINLKGKKTKLEVEELSKYVHKKFRIVDPLNSVSPASHTPRSIQNMKGYLKIQVSDTGCGVDPSVLPKIFTMYTQSASRAHKDDNSAGLGLWICKQLCQKMGGDVKAYSQLHHGSTFVLYIPVDQTVKSPQVRNICLLDKHTIRALVVDDFSYNRDVHKVILEKQGVEVMTVCNGKEALDAVTNHPENYFDFIMMDINMPIMDGFTASKEIRQYEREHRKKHIDIYFVSGDYDTRMITNSEAIKSEKAVTKFLPKPIDISAIKKIVDLYGSGLKFSFSQKTSQYKTLNSLDSTSPTHNQNNNYKSTAVKKTLTSLILEENY